MCVLVLGAYLATLDRLVPHRRRLETALPARRAGRGGAAGHRRAAQPVVLPRGRAALPRRTEHAAPVPVLAVAVAAAGPAGRLLLDRRRRLRRGQLRRRDPAARHAGAVVGVHARRWSAWPGSASAGATGGPRRSAPMVVRRHRCRGSTTSSSSARCSTSTRCRPSRSWSSPSSTCSAALINGPGVGPARPTAGSASRFTLPAEDRRLYGTIFAGAFVTARRALLLVVLPPLRRRGRSPTRTGCGGCCSATAGFEPSVSAQRLTVAGQRRDQGEQPAVVLAVQSLPQARHDPHHRRVAGVDDGPDARRALPTGDARPTAGPAPCRAGGAASRPRRAGRARAPSPSQTRLPMATTRPAGSSTSRARPTAGESSRASVESVGQPGAGQVATQPRGHRAAAVQRDDRLQVVRRGPTYDQLRAVGEQQLAASSTGSGAAGARARATVATSIIA